MAGSCGHGTPFPTLSPHAHNSDSIELPLIVLNFTRERVPSEERERPQVYF